jgi:hypothetical protein
VRSYLAVLRVRHARPLLVAALVGRLSFAMGTVALVLFVQHATGSFAVAGVVSAAAFLANGLLAPVRGRLVDRYGLRRTLPSLAVGYAAALVGLVVAVSADPANTLAAVEDPGRFAAIGRCEEGEGVAGREAKGRFGGVRGGARCPTGGSGQHLVGEVEADHQGAGGHLAGDVSDAARRPRAGCAPARAAWRLPGGRAPGAGSRG